MDKLRQEEMRNNINTARMRIIISPAKKMNRNTEAFACRGLPRFLLKARQLTEYIQSLGFEQCKEIWRCNKKIAELNFQRFREMDLERGLTPAVLSFEGIQYQYMAPAVMEETALDYLEERLRILSGFYGLLRPFDGVAPYRLEMQAKLGGYPHNPGLHSLYDYWGDELAEALFAEGDFILNLASKEYSRCISPYLREDITFVTCVFGEERDGRVVEKGTLAKMARGEMVRFLAENRIEDIQGIRGFDRLGYKFSGQYSKERTIVFLKEGRGYSESDCID